MQIHAHYNANIAIVRWTRIWLELQKQIKMIFKTNTADMQDQR